MALVSDLSLLCLSLAFLLILSQRTVDTKRTAAPQKARMDPGEPALPEIDTLTDGEHYFRCFYRKATCANERCQKTIADKQRYFVGSVLRAIVWKLRNGQRPGNLFAELATHHYCGHHMKKARADSRFINALLGHWRSTWDAVSGAADDDLVPPPSDENAPRNGPPLDGLPLVAPFPEAVLVDTLAASQRADEALCSPPATPAATPPPENGRVAQPVQYLDPLAAEPARGREITPPATPESRIPTHPTWTPQQAFEAEHQRETALPKWNLAPIPAFPELLHNLILKTQLSVNQLKPGYVYILQRPGCKHYYKVGVTTRDTVGKRLAEQRRQCNVDWELQACTASAGMLVPNAERVEKLVHLEFQMRGRRFKDLCYGNDDSACTTEHDEVVQGELDEVRRAVEYWAAWMQTFQPYDAAGKITPPCVDYALDRDLDADADARRFCEMSNGERWVRRSGSNPPAPPEITLRCTPPPTPETPTRPLRRSARRTRVGSAAEPAVDERSASAPPPPPPPAPTRPRLDRKEASAPAALADAADLFSTPDAEGFRERETCGLGNGVLLDACEACRARDLIDRQGCFVLPCTHLRRLSPSSAGRGGGASRRRSGGSVQDEAGVEAGDGLKGRRRSVGVVKRSEAI